DQPVGELSRGLRQRVAIGQAIIHEPKVLILDEPASGLDPEARHDLAELFRALQKGGMTLLVSSHILAELGAYATDMLVIRGGRIIEQRTLKDAAPLTRQIVIELADTNAAIGAVLDARENVHNIRSDGRRVACELTGDDDAQHQLLRALITANIAVVSFAALERDLQQSYLDSMKAP
ncbi:MAG: AAA family ATPase, partial [Gammaproteobacteria bacterium]